MMLLCQFLHQYVIHRIGKMRYKRGPIAGQGNIGGHYAEPVAGITIRKPRCGRAEAGRGPNWPQTFGGYPIYATGYGPAAMLAQTPASTVARAVFGSFGLPGTGFFGSNQVSRRRRSSASSSITRCSACVRLCSASMRRCSAAARLMIGWLVCGSYQSSRPCSHRRNRLRASL